MGGREGGADGPFPTPLLFCSWQGSVGFLGSGVPERVKLIPRDMMAQANWGHLEDAGDLKFPQSTSLTGKDPAMFRRQHTIKPYLLPDSSTGPM